MSVNSHDFIEYANKIIEVGDNSSICFRSAMSRAYYGVYHHAKKTADDKQFPDFKGSMHSTLAFRYENENHKEVAYILKDLHQARCDADYEINYTVDKEKIKKDIIRCGKLIEKIDQLSGNALKESKSKV